jgi:hypothetical protein
MIFIVNQQTILRFVDILHLIKIGILYNTYFYHYIRAYGYLTRTFCLYFTDSFFSKAFSISASNASGLVVGA